MGVSPLQPTLPGEQYLRTFDARFHVQPAAELRTSPFSYDALQAYRSDLFVRFEASHGSVINVQA